MTFTINADMTNWDSTSKVCTFDVNPDGTGSLDAELVPGGVFPPLSLFFVIVDHNEILAIRIKDSVVASGVLKRQAP
jgi:hypothetical protein